MVRKYLPIRQNEPIEQGSETTSKFYNLRKFLGGLNALCTFKKLGEGKTFFILCVLLNNISVTFLMRSKKFSHMMRKVILEVVEK